VNEKITRGKFEEKQFKRKNMMKNSFASAEMTTLTFCGDGKIYFDENKKLKSNSDSEKFLEMKMTDDGESLKMFSLLWLKRVMEAAAGGPVIDVQKKRNGTAIIETANKEQAKNLIKLVNIAGIYSVTLSEMVLPMRSRGVIWLLTRLAIQPRSGNS
jgi:hypothetical protein